MIEAPHWSIGSMASLAEYGRSIDGFSPFLRGCFRSQKQTSGQKLRAFVTLDIRVVAMYKFVHLSRELRTKVVPPHLKDP